MYGTDHAGNEMRWLYTKTFALCLDTCSSRPGCVSDAYSGVACCMKTGVGAEVDDGVWAMIAASPTSS
jgi:hypothetical protein